MEPRLKACGLLLVLMAACVEPYQFVIENNTRALVVEGFISDVSYQETIEYPSDGRFFSVKLSYASDVTNVRGEAVSGATVALQSRAGESWEYSEATPGEYLLLDNDFKADVGKEYRLSILLAGGEEFESDWESMPEGEKLSVGKVSFQEQTRNIYQVVAGKQQIVAIKGIAVFTDLPPVLSKQTRYYRWDFDPTWVFHTPPPPPPVINPVCWIRSDAYLSEYVTVADQVGSYQKELLFMETVENDRLYEQFSLLIRQFIMNEGYYQFWNEMEARMKTEINDTPPYNLTTNLRAVSGTTEVVGYFGVVQESATRWYFSISDLSYYVENTIEADCEINYDPRVPSHCEDCLLYPNGEATLEKPAWWKK